MVSVDKEAKPAPISHSAIRSGWYVQVSSRFDRGFADQELRCVTSGTGRFRIA